MFLADVSLMLLAFAPPLQVGSGRDALKIAPAKREFVLHVLDDETGA